jgi:hypothetical protein
MGIDGVFVLCEKRVFEQCLEELFGCLDTVINNNRVALIQKVKVDFVKVGLRNVIAFIVFRVELAIYKNHQNNDNYYQ